MATRRERVVLDLDDNFTTGMIRAAAAAALLKKELDGLDGAGRRGGASLDRSVSSTDDLGRSANKSGAEIDKLSGRVRVLADVAAILGPSLVPIGAAGIPAVTGLAAQFGFAATAAGVGVLAFQGVGDALKAMNKAGLEPTTANLDKAALAMDQISPTAQKFVRQLRSMIPELSNLRDTAAEGLFPGLTEGLDSLESALPKVERIVAAVAGELGNIASDSGASLASPRWAEFLTFLATDAPSALRDMAAAAGNTGHAMAELWMAFDPLNDDFSRWLVNSTADLDKWATGLDKTDGFQEFTDYIRANGPQVEETLAAMGDAVLQIVEATAPLGGPVLKGIEAFSKAISAIADSDLGTPIFAGLAALSLYNRALAVGGALSKATFGGRIVGDIKKQRTAISSLRQEYQGFAAVQRSNKGGYLGAPMGGVSAVQIKQAEKFKSTMRDTAATAGKTAGAVGALALLTTGYADKTGYANTATLALAGSMAGPWGAAAGAGAGLFLDLASGASGFTDGLKQVDNALKQNSLTIAENRLAKLKSREADINKTSGVGDFFNDITKSSGASLAALLPGATVTSDAVDKAKKKVKEFQQQAAEKTWVTDSRGGLHKVAEGFGTTAVEARKAAAGIRASRKAANDVAHSFVGLGDSLDDSKVSLNSWIRDLEQSADALTNFASNAVKAARRGLRDGLIKELQAAGPAGALRMKQLADGTSAQITRANAAWVKGRKAIRAYTDAVGGVPSHKTTKIIENGALPARVRIKAMKDEIARLKNKSVHLDEQGALIARGKIAALRDAINSLRSRTITINYHGVRTGAAVGGKIAKADGGQVLAGDGQSRGPRDDSIEAVLSHREYVQPVAAVDYYGENFMEAVRQRTFPKPEGFADGGLVGPQEFASGGSARRSSGGSLRHRFHELSAAVHDSTKAIDRERTRRDALVDKRNELKSSVAGKFKTDLFGESNVWAPGGGTGGTLGILKADIAKAKAFQSTLKGLRHRGLNGDALAELAQTGDIGKAQAMASMSNKDLRAYEALYDQRTRAANAVGSYAGNAAYGTAIAAQTRELQHSNRELRAMKHHLALMEKRLHHLAKDTGHEVAKGVNHAAGKSRSRK